MSVQQGYILVACYSLDLTLYLDAGIFAGVHVLSKHWDELATGHNLEFKVRFGAVPLPKYRL